MKLLRPNLLNPYTIRSKQVSSYCISAALQSNTPRRFFAKQADPKDKDDDDGIYKPEKDPMAGLTEEEKEQIRYDILNNTRRAASYGYAFLGACCAVLAGGIMYQNSKGS